ncbi:hypothetical protein AAOGI_41460 [Agarivorans albus]
MFKYNLFAMAILLLSPYATAANSNTGYYAVTEVKVWPTYIDINSEAKNHCVNESNSGHAFRYILDKSEKEMFSLLLSAMTSGMKANISYYCQNNLAYIYGARVKP